MNKILTLSLFLSSIFIISSCSYVQKIKDGSTAYDRKQYSKAITMLNSEYKKTKSRVEKGKIAYMLGDSYKRTNQIEKSVNWFLAAYDNSYGVDAQKEYAYALKRTGQYEDAMKAFKNLGIEIGSPYEYRREITACKLALDWLSRKDKTGYTVELLPFNTSNADYAPSIYKDGQLLFTSDRNSSTGEDTYYWTGNNFSDVFLANPADNSVDQFDMNINTPANEGTVVFNKDYTEMIFTRCYDEEKNTDNYCKLMTSSFEEGAWTAAVPLNFTEEKINYGHPAFSADGSTLYFSSNHPDGWGGYDIYSAERTADGWDVPRVLSRSINTSGNEKFPTIDKDTLYFASDHHPGLGGLDIFKSYKMGNGNWSPVNNVLPPINSSGDDFAMVIDYDSQKEEDVLQLGYFSSTREKGAGNDDIYRFERRLPPPPPPLPDTVEEKPIVYKLLLDVYVLEKIYKFADNPNSKVLGRKPLPSSKLNITINGKNKKSIEINESGLYELEMDENTDYRFLAEKEGYLNNISKFSTKGIGKDPNNPILKFELEIELDKIFINQEIVLENIYYDYDRWDIRADAQPTLNELSGLLNRNPNINIQLSSHTDCRGQNNYNQNLSQRRAESAVEYLITKGIAAERLTAVGYGESIPADDCVCTRCTEEEHQSNRRTTFKILDQGFQN